MLRMHPQNSPGPAAIGRWSSEYVASGDMKFHKRTCVHMCSEPLACLKGATLSVQLGQLVGCIHKTALELTCPTACGTCQPNLMNANA